MDKQSLFLLFIVCFLAGCNNQAIGELPQMEREFVLKENISKAFFQLYDIVPIYGENSYVEVVDWYDDETLIYLLEDNGSSIIKMHDLFTGDEKIFFESKDSIASVQLNQNKKLLAISTVNDTGNSSFYIINPSGKIVYQNSGIIGDIDFQWNLYDDQQLLITVYLPNWEFEVYHLSVDQGTMKKLDINQTYIQWVDKETLAYLDWDISEPNFFAPLMIYNLKTGEKEHFLEDVIAFFTFPNQILTALSVKSIYDLETKYSFYHQLEKKGETFVPILDTLSEQWWIPYYDYDEKKGSFLFFRPKYSTTFIDYDESYELVRFQIESGKDEIIMELDDHYPIQLSPNGKWLLYGQQFEYLIDLSKKKIHLILRED